MSEVETRVKLRLRRHGELGPNVSVLLEILRANGWSVADLGAHEGHVVTFTRGDES